MSEPAFTFEEAGDLLVLRFDLPGEKVNLLRKSTLDELEQRLDAAATRRGTRALLIESGKATSFIAGADVHAIAELPDQAAAEAAARRGQAVFTKLSALPFPSVALIHGACVGGGLELALACTHRVASDAAATRLGLPEVLLGIVPGFGGTQRLPRTIGLLAALPLLLSGRLIPANAARRLGLVDEVAARQQLRAAARRVLDDPPRRGPPSASRRWSEAAVRTIAPLRRWILGRAAADVRTRTGGCYPAPFRILEAVAAGYARGGDAGSAVEAAILAELLAGPVSRSLVRLFMLSEEVSPASDDARAVSRVFVAGAGQMGSTIAALFAAAGVRTRLHDPASDALARGVERANQLLRHRFRDDATRAREAVDRLEPSPGRQGLRHVDLLLEAVVEKLDVKQRLLEELEPQLPDRAWIATNTSSLDLDQLAATLHRKERLVGLHFFHPADKMKLVEVVRGSFTDERAVAFACSLARRLGKVPVVVANRPGFLVNRMLAPYLLEAERLVNEGTPIEALDRAAREAGMALGPVELLDEIGLDVALHVGDVMRAAFPDRFADVGLVRRLVSGGSLGKKSGRGFYVHGKRRRPSAQLGSAVRRNVSPDQPVSLAVACHRLFSLVAAEGRRCLDERVAASEEEIDLALMLGAGFLIPHGGPMRWSRTRAAAEPTREGFSGSTPPR